MQVLEADHILIPLLDGTYALAQVAYAGDTFGGIFLTDKTALPTSKSKPLAKDDIIASAEVDFATIPDGHWPVIGYEAVPPVYDNRNEPVSDLEIHDAAIIEALANALRGLYPWDGFPDPDFFTRMLTENTPMPPRARMAAHLPQPEGT